MTHRNYGLDTCRIFAMIGIIIIHVVTQGGILESCTTYSLKYWVVEWIYICAECSVDVFAILSGYFGIQKKTHSSYRVIELISVVFFYSVIITTLFLVISPESFESYKNIVKALVPSIFGRYWYITCFVPVLLLQPYINYMINAFSVKQLRTLNILIFTIFSIIPSIVHVDIFRLYDGFSFLWLVILYLLGAYLYKSNFWISRNRKSAIFIFVLLSLFLLGINMLIENFTNRQYNYLVSYISPVTLCMSVAIIMFFINIKVCSEKVKMVVSSVSNATFDAYIIHTHVCIFDIILLNSFVWISNIPFFLIPLLVMGSSIVVFVMCDLIGILRIKMFKIIKINFVLKNISLRIDRIIYKEMLSSPTTSKE